MSDFSNEWLVGYLAKREREREKSFPLPEEAPDIGLESNLQKKLIQYCREHGWPCFHDRSKRVNDPGWPDNIIFLPGGKVVLIELKSASGRLRKEQLELRRILGWNDHMVYIARSFKRVVEIIERELRSDGMNKPDVEKGK